MIKTMRTNNFSVFADFTPDFVVDSALGFIVGPVSNSIIISAYGSVTGLALSSVNNSAFGSITISAFNAIASSVVLVIINFKTTFFYGKPVIAEDYSNSKLYIKETILIKAILFGETIDA